MCKSLRILIARNRPGLEILKQSTLICWPRNQLPFTSQVAAVVSNSSLRESVVQGSRNLAILGDK